MGHVCDTFINRPKGSYRPLACKPIVVTTRELRGTGAANKQDLFFLIKPNTFREHATIDLLFTHPPYSSNVLFTLQMVISIMICRFTQATLCCNFPFLIFYNFTITVRADDTFIILFHTSTAILTGLFLISDNRPLTDADLQRRNLLTSSS